MRRWRVVLALLFVAALVLLPSCGADMAEERNDAPVAGNNDEPAFRISFPDGFGNVARKCDGHVMVYSSRVSGESSGRSIAVIPNDPRCEGVTG